MGDTMELATLARDSASPLGDSSERVMVEKSHQDSDSKIEFSIARVCVQISRPDNTLIQFTYKKQALPTSVVQTSRPDLNHWLKECAPVPRYR